ncbi:MAG: DUF3011 domain-containing protein [Luteimonas sp.]
MRASFVPGLLFVLAGGLAADAAAAPQYAPYGNGYPSNQPDQTVRCESSNGRIRRCQIDTSRGVRLLRQLSDSACLQGRKWGYDRDGVWVTQGCRAEFAVGGYGDTYGGAYADGNPGQVFRCESSDGRRRQCATDTRGGVELVRQLSDAACVRGQTWGWDERGVWVDNGCRAEFRSGAGGNNRPGYAGNARTLRCESVDGRYRLCTADARGGVRLARQISGEACVEGRTWGINRQGVWVDGGCRGDFELGVRDNNGWAWGSNRPDNGYNDGNYNDGYGGRTVRCESSDGRVNRCNMAVQGVRLQRQVSDAQCQQGQTWGWDRGGIWVSGGCRADFAVW